MSSAARHFLTHLNLRYFATSRERLFRARLDEATWHHSRSLPKGTKSWGSARKVLNIFLREALYTSYLAQYSGIAKAERFLDVPLDSITGKRLREHAGRGGLPQWPGVKHLTVGDSDQYQALARLIASQQENGSRSP
jgi:hypothetical protein